jgi:malonyl-CoA O-methyltransferase
MRAEQKAMLEYWPDVAGKRVLDLACGTGRYTRRLIDDNAATVVALDLCDGMLRQVAAPNRVQADMMKLPLCNGCFDVVVSGLAVGHAHSIDAWMNEVARVLGDEGVLLYSDFHPKASLAGLARSFTDDSGRKVTVPHTAHELVEHRDAAYAAGLTIDIVCEMRAGREIAEEFSGSDEFYGQWRDLPLLLIVGAHKR